MDDLISIDNTIYEEDSLAREKKIFADELFQTYTSRVQDCKQTNLGYPGNHNIKLDEFYHWYLRHGIYKVCANNAGDPFDTPKKYLNTLDFERKVIEYFGPLYGFEINNLWGILTSSGTDGNNHGIYFGAKYLERKTQKKPIVYVSDAAHYSNMHLADLQNLDLVIIPADEHGCMIPDKLDQALVSDRPALIIYAMGTTFKGGVDNQYALNAVLKKHPSITVYRHIDAALFGGYLPYTDYRDAINCKVHSFDSIAISGHKFFGLDEPTGIFLTTMEIKNNQTPYNIAYINGNMPMINCSRSAISALKFWWLINHVGTKGFATQAAQILQYAKWFKHQLDKIGWPAWLEPMSNTVYFKRPPQKIIDKYALSLDRDDRLCGDLAHIVIMQHVTQKSLHDLLNDFASLLKQK